MATEAPPAPNLEASRSALLESLSTGYAQKAAGKLTADDPTPPGFESPAGDHSPSPTGNGAAPPAPAAAPSPAPAPKPTPVAARPTPEPPATPEAKRIATAQQWKEVNEERATLKARLAELEGERTKWTQTAQAAEEAAQLKAKLTEYDSILRQVAAERHPDLIGPINQKIQGAIALAKSAVGKDQGDVIARILSQPDSEERDAQLDSILDSLSTTKRARLIKAMTDVEEANSQRAMLAQHSQQALTQRELAMKQRHEQNLSLFDAEASDWTNPEHGIDLLIEKPGDVGHNERRNAILSNAKALFSGQVSSPRDLARAAIWSAFGETLNRQNLALLQQVKQLNDEITRIKGGGPGLEQSGGSGEGDAQNEKPKDMSLAEWIALSGKREGVQFGRTA